MGREIVYCWKCATKVRGEDFDNGDAFRVGDKVSCSGCVDELVADLSAEEQEAILSPPQKKTPSRPIKKISSTNLSPAEKSEGGTGTSRRTGTVQRTGKTTTTGAVQRVRTGTTGPVPTASGGGGRNTSTGVRKKVTASIPKVQPPPEEGEEGMEEGDEKPPMDEKKKKLLIFGGIGGGLFLIIAVLLIVVLTKKPAPKPKAEETAEDNKPKVVAGTTESPKEKEAKAALKAAFDLKASKPDALGEQLKKFREAEAAAAGLSLAADIATAIDEVLARLDKAIASVGDQVKQQYSDFDYKTVLETYEKAKALHEVPEWTERIDTKIKLTRNRVEDTFHQFKRQIEDKTQAGEDPEIEKKKAIVAKWEMPEYVEKFDRFVSLLAAAPDPGKNPADPVKPATPGNLNVRQLSPSMKAFMPAWQTAMALAFSRDFASAVTEMTGAAARAESDEAKKAGAEDLEVLKALGERFQEFLKVAAETPNLTTLTVEYQDKPGEWKKVTGKTIKVQPTRMEFQPDPVDKKPQPAIFIEFTDLNAGSLATLYKARKKTLVKKDADLLAKFALIEGATEAAQAIGAAPDRFWIYAAEAREKAPKPPSREFEARVLFHQSEFEWRKSVTKYNAIEKSKLLLSDYTSTAIVKRYQPAIAKRAETGKEFIFLPSDLVVNGDYNTFKAGKKEDPSWITSKGIDFKDSLFNYVEAEFISLPGLTYKCWVYAGGCCQEVWNGSFQATEMTTKNRGKDVPIDPGVQMAAPLPMPTGLRKEHDDHKPRREKGKPEPEHPKTPDKWHWIQIPLPKSFIAPGAKQVRILTDQQGFGVKYVIISSSRPKSPDDATAKELAKEALAAPAPKLDIKGEATPKQWYVIGPFADGLSSEQAPERGIELGKPTKGKTADVKWKLVNATLSGQQVVFDWEKATTFNPKVNVSVYAMIHVKAPAGMDARLFISHDDGGRAWLNGTKVHDNEKSGGGAVKADEFNVAIKLEEGWNRLLIKVNQGTGAFGLMMRITDAAKAPIAGLEYSPYGDSLDPP